MSIRHRGHQTSFLRMDPAKADLVIKEEGLSRENYPGRRKNQAG